jgi:hypothetical protein
VDLVAAERRLKDDKNMLITLGDFSIRPGGHTPRHRRHPDRGQAAEAVAEQLDVLDMDRMNFGYQSGPKQTETWLHRDRPRTRSSWMFRLPSPTLTRRRRRLHISRRPLMSWNVIINNRVDVAEYVLRRFELSRAPNSVRADENKLRRCFGRGWR